MTFDSLLIHKCYLGTKSTTSNSLGEIKESWSYSTSTKCRMSPISDSERIQMSGKYENVRFTAFFKEDANISNGNRIKYNGQEYLITASHLDSSSHHITALIMEL